MMWPTPIDRDERMQLGPFTEAKVSWPRQDTNEVTTTPPPAAVSAILSSPLLSSPLFTDYHSFTLLVIIRDEANIQAENGVETAIKYLTGNNMTNINKQSMVTLTGQPVNAAGDSKYLT